MRRVRDLQSDLQKLGGDELGDVDRFGQLLGGWTGIEHVLDPGVAYVLSSMLFARLTRSFRQCQE